jgi:hypothetical protein
MRSAARLTINTHSTKVEKFPVPRPPSGNQGYSPYTPRPKVRQTAAYHTQMAAHEPSCSRKNDSPDWKRRGSSLNWRNNGIYRPGGAEGCAHPFVGQP